MRGTVDVPASKE